MKAIISIIISLTMACGLASVPIIMVDENGVERVETLSKESYQKSFSYVLDQANQASQQLDSSQKKSGGWKLSKFMLGLGLEGTVGLGPWDLGLALKQRFIFTK